MDNVSYILLLALSLLLLATYLMLVNEKSFWKIFAVHTLVFISYMTLVINYSKLFTKQDPYGLEQIALGMLFIIGHIIIGFAHGLYVTLKRRKTQ